MKRLPLQPWRVDDVGETVLAVVAVAEDGEGDVAVVGWLGVGLKRFSRVDSLASA